MTFDQALNQLMCYGDKLSEAYQVLACDASNAFSTRCLSKQHLATVLKLYLSQQIDDDDLTLWAQIIENQAAIDTYEVEDYLYALTNAEMMGEVSHDTITKMVNLLTGSPTCLSGSQHE